MDALDVLAGKTLIAAAVIAVAVFVILLISRGAV